MKRNGVVVFKKPSEMPEYIYDECLQANFGYNGGLRYWITDWALQRGGHRRDRVYVNLVEGHVVSWAQKNNRLVYIYTIPCARRIGYAREIVEVIERQFPRFSCYKSGDRSSSTRFWEKMGR